MFFCFSEVQIWEWACYIIGQHTHNRSETANRASRGAAEVGIFTQTMDEISICFTLLPALDMVGYWNKNVLIFYNGLSLGVIRQQQKMLNIAYASLPSI